MTPTYLSYCVTMALYRPGEAVIPLWRYHLAAAEARGV